MERLINCGLKKIISSLICIGFLTVILVPASGLAVSVISSGTASIDWSYLTFTYIDDSTGNPIEVNWLDADFADTRSSLSSAEVMLNGTYSDPNTSDYIEGPWANTAATASLIDANGHAIGDASTTVAGTILASSDAVLTSMGAAIVFIAQAVFAGDFTVAGPGTLSITAPYSLTQSVFSDTPFGVAYNDVLVGLFLSDFDTGVEILSDFRFSPLLVNGVGNDSFSDSGTLQLLNISLIPGIIYDFEASASTVASAATPEPGTIFLIGSGLIGVATALRRRFKKEV